MKRSVCSYIENGKRCGKVTRARRDHKFCRPHTLKATGIRRPIPHQVKKTRVIKPAKPAPVVVVKKGKK